MSDPIMVTIGVADEINHMPMSFLIYDDGVMFDNDFNSFTRKDMEISRAVLMDLADALGEKLRLTTN